MTETTILVCIAVQAAVGLQAAIQLRACDKRCNHNGGAIAAKFVLRALQEEHTDFEYSARVVQWLYVTSFLHLASVFY